MSILTRVGAAGAVLGFVTLGALVAHAHTLPPQAAVREVPNARVCPPSGGAGAADCHARVVIDGKSGQPVSNSTPSGYGPATFKAAYNLPASIGGHPVIAIVDAYDDPYIAADLATYSKQYGLSALPTCTSTSQLTQSACFLKVNQNGQAGHYPRANSGWALEISLDVEVAHGTCPDCSILLVEASTNSFSNLLTAENTAAALGAHVISNSWGGNEFSSESAYDSYFNHPGVAVTVSSGDSGYGAQYPAASPYVTAVGGTTLTMSGASYASESAWSGAGSGCSAYEAKPTWQTDTACAKRTIADVSADADPATGAAVYDSYGYSGQRGWFQVGGTSLAAPLIAAVYALSGNTSGSANSLPYAAAAGSLHDVTTGQNGSCGGSYLCTAMAGYDGPTGLGTPNGTSAF